MSRFTDYVEFVGRRPMSWRHELISTEGELLASSTEADATNGVCHWKPVSPALTFDVGRSAVRSGPLSATIDPDKFPLAQLGLLDPSARNRVVISAGLVDDAGAVDWKTVGTLGIDDANAIDEAGAVRFEMRLLDPTEETDIELSEPFGFDEGETVEDVVTRLLSIVFTSPAAYTVTPTGFTVPSGSFDAGESVARLIAQLLEGCGHELTANPEGRLVTRRIPASTDTSPSESWRYGQSDGLAIGWLERHLRRREVRGYIVEGGGISGSEPTVVRKILDTDPRSRGYFRGPATAKLPRLEFPFALTVPQVEAAGYGQLRRNGSGPGLVTFQTAPNPHLRPFDQVDIERDRLGLDGTFQVIGFSLPTVIRPGATMSITARQLWDPEQNIRAAIEENPSFVTTFSDDFQRADEDLQGDDWVELWYSWGVEGQLAISRNRNNWCMALVRTSMGSTDHSAATTITKIPAGLPVGPVVRSPGTFEGYAALADASGNVYLESWLGGRSDHRLATANVGSAVNKIVLLQAVGTSISVSVDGVEVISVEDDRHLGGRVGMLGLGGPSSNAPSVSLFTAAEVSA